MKQALNIIKYALFLGVGLVLFWLVYRGQDWHKMGEAMKDLNYGWVVVCFFVSILSHLIRGLRWNMLIRPLGYTVNARNSFIAVMLGYLANLAIPRAGEVSRCVVLNRTNKVPVDKLVGTVFTERLIDFISLMLLVLLNFLLEFGKLKDFFQNNVVTKLQGLQQMMTTTYLVIIGAVFLGMAFAAYFAHRRFSRTGFYTKIWGILTGFLSGMRTVWMMEKSWLFILYSIALWGSYYLMVYICFFSLGATAHLGMVAALSVLVIGSFGFVAPVQGGVGAYHGAVLLALLMYGVAEQDAKNFAMVAYTFQTLVTIIVGGFSYLALTIIVRRAAANPENMPEPDASLTADSPEILQ